MKRVMKPEEPATTRVIPITVVSSVSWVWGTIGRYIDGMGWSRRKDLRIEWKMIPHSMTRTLEVSSGVNNLSAGSKASSSLLGLFARVSPSFSASPLLGPPADLGATPWLWWPPFPPTKRWTTYSATKATKSPAIRIAAVVASYVTPVRQSLLKRREAWVKS